MDCLKCGHKLWGSVDSSECVNERCGDVEPIPVPLVWGLKQGIEEFFGLNKKDPGFPAGHWRAVGISENGPIWAKVDENEQENRSNH